MNQEVADLIKDYAKVYSQFEDLQKGDNGKSTLPGGDQKTGVIAEYFALEYIDWKYPNSRNGKRYEDPGSPHDLTYKDPNTGEQVNVQVKAVSAHSKTRTISPIKLKHEKDGKLEKSFDKLYLISLDENFLPDGFWINDYEPIEKEVLDHKPKSKNDNESKRWKIEGAFMKGKSIPTHNRNSAGSSKYLDFRNDLIDELRAALGLKLSVARL